MDQLSKKRQRAAIGAAVILSVAVCGIIVISSALNNNNNNGGSNGGSNGNAHSSLRRLTHPDPDAIMPLPHLDSEPDVNVNVNVNVTATANADFDWPDRKPREHRGDDGNDNPEPRPAMMYGDSHGDSDWPDRRPREPRGDDGNPKVVNVNPVVDNNAKSNIPNVIDIVCPDGRDPIPNTFCGRGPNRANCANDEFCFVEPADGWAVCCPNIVPDLETVTDAADIEVKCCDLEAYDSSLEAGSYCCNDGNWYPVDGSGGGICSDHGLDASDPCPPPADDIQVVNPPTVDKNMNLTEIKCCDPKTGPGGCPDENGSFDRCWDEGGYCCSDGNWYADPGDGSGNCRENGLENSKACIVEMESVGDAMLDSEGEGEGDGDNDGEIRPCQILSKKQCAKAPECEYDNSFKQCASSLYDKIHHDKMLDFCARKRPKECDRHGLCDLNHERDCVPATEGDGGKMLWVGMDPVLLLDGSDPCALKGKRECKKDKECKYHPETGYCSLKEGETTTTKTTTTTSTSTIKPAKYWPLTAGDGYHTECVYSSEYPETYSSLEDLTGKPILFDSHEMCCSVYHPCVEKLIEGEGEDVVDVVKISTSATAPTEPRNDVSTEATDPIPFLTDPTEPGPSTITTPYDPLPVYIPEHTKECAIGPSAPPVLADACSDDEIDGFCFLEMGVCNSRVALHYGICARRSVSCPADYDPVCCCDGNTYGNLCEAHAAGANVARMGACDDHFGDDAEEVDDVDVDPEAPARPTEMTAPEAPTECVVGDPETAKDLYGDTMMMCGDHEYCHLPDGTCHDESLSDEDGMRFGSCASKPQLCHYTYEPVCGCDGTTYGNSCEAYGAGASIAMKGECDMGYDDVREVLPPEIPMPEELPTVEPPRTNTVQVFPEMPEPDVFPWMHEPRDPEDDVETSSKVDGTGIQAVGQYGQCSDDSNCEGDLVCHPNKLQCTCNTANGGGCSKPGQICGVSVGLYCPHEGCLPTCSCDWDSDADDGSNGCDVGEVCRQPCAIADAGHMCFKSNEERDCDIYGEGYACRDSNADGKIDKLDGASGCVPQLVQPKIEEVFFIADMVDDGGDDGDQPKINVDPLDEMESHPLPDGAEFLKEDGSTVSPTDHVPQLLDGPMNPHDPTWPNSATFPAVIETSTTEAPAEESAAVATTTSATPTVTTKIPAEAAPNTGTEDLTIQSAYATECEWHIGVFEHNTCTNTGIYPPSWDDLPAEFRHNYFYSTAEACCIGTQFHDECVVVDECIPSDARPDPMEGCDTWHMDLTEVFTCTNSGFYPSVWNEEYLRDQQIHSSPEDCCKALFPNADCVVLDVCSLSSSISEGDHDASSNSACPWHIHSSEWYTCTNSPDYPEDFNREDHREHMLFDTAEECCKARFPDGECITMNECESLGDDTTLEKGQLLPQTLDETGGSPVAESAYSIECQWHIDASDYSICTNTDNYPPAWDDMSAKFRNHYFFSTAEDCCNRTLTHFQNECVVVDQCSPLIRDGSTGPTESVTSDFPEIVTDCRWHFHRMDSNTCTNSNDYPRAWDGEDENSAHVFYATAEECCQGLDADDVGECIMIDDCTPDVIKLHPHQLLTDIPWIFGDNPQWRYDDSVAHVGHLWNRDGSVALDEDVNADSRSVTNISIEGEPGATADLSLKLMLPDSATLICAAKIDTRMPFDFFAIIVNGKEGNQYYDSFMDGDEWTEIKLGLPPGINRIIFRVKESKHDPGFNRQGQYGDYGSGRVWLDQCRISSHA